MRGRKNTFPPSLRFRADPFMSLAFNPTLELLPWGPSLPLSFTSFLNFLSTYSMLDAGDTVESRKSNTVSLPLWIVTRLNMKLQRGQCGGESVENIVGFAVVWGTQGEWRGHGSLRELYPLLISLAPSQLPLIILQGLVKPET